MLSSIGTLEIGNQSLVVIHEPVTGRIFHMHYVNTMKGGVHPTPAVIEADAREQLNLAQPGLLGKMSALHLDPGIVKPRTAYSVDVKTGTLVEVNKLK